MKSFVNWRAELPEGKDRSARGPRTGPSAVPTLVATAFAVLFAALPVHAASTPKKTKNTSSDSTPVLMSKTGGGDMWADVKELQQAADKGNPKAQAQLGEMLLRGDGIAKNETRAVSLLEKAARAGNSAGAFRVGMLLMNGEAGVAKDPARALQYFRAAAAGGEKEAFFNIGAAYGSARGVKRDYGEALGWLIVARQRGADPNAEKNLRAQIQSQPAWIARGERRAKEIPQEFAGKKVADFLPPPAPLDSVAETLQPTGLNLSPTVEPDVPSKPRLDLKPAPIKPDLPSLPPPSVKP